MKRNAKKLLVILLVLVVTGFARLPFEQKLALDLRAAGIIQEPIDLDTRTKLGQTTYAVALGGLRSLVAALRNIQAHVFFEHQEWFKVEESYNTITTLQPRTRYYWDAGSHHLAYNAYADYGDKPGMPEARRRLRQKEFLAKGRALLEEGLENNPDDWRLWSAYGRLLSDPFKPKDLPAAAEAYRRARECPGAPYFTLSRALLYVESRVPDGDERAWKTAREVWAEPSSRSPSAQSHFFTLEWAHVPAAERTPLEEIFGSRTKALRNLSWYSMRKRDGFPMHGVRETLLELCEEFEVPDEFNPVLNPDWRGFPPGFLEY